MQTSTIVGTVMIVAAVALAVSAPKLARLPTWKVTVFWRFDRRPLSEFGQRLLTIHIEICAVVIAAFGVSVLPVPTDIASIVTLIGDTIFAVNLLLVIFVTTPAILIGKATINPPKKNKRTEA